MNVIYLARILSGIKDLLYRTHSKCYPQILMLKEYKIASPFSKNLILYTKVFQQISRDPFNGTSDVLIQKSSYAKMKNKPLNMTVAPVTAIIAGRTTAPELAPSTARGVEICPVAQLGQEVMTVVLRTNV